MIVKYHGHSCVQLTDGEHSVIIDPFLTGNPSAVAEPGDVKVQYVLLTHAHGDHVADAEAIARANDATIIATYELATYYSWKGLRTIGLNIGGGTDIGFARVKLVQAFHSSGMIVEEGKILYMGMPGGFVVEWNDATLFHAGDTGLFGDMKMFGEQYDIDLAFLPIGDLLTMGPSDALIAAEWLKAKRVVPIHYNTFPGIRQDPEKFAKELKKRDIKGIALPPGETYELKS
ncbi:MAG: metal-dependent hydrolase [Paenibacillus sp.]|nr:metal-dependent hydrolase [Paenibacillus sp.]